MSDYEHPLDRFLRTGVALHVAADGQMLFSGLPGCPPVKALLPGSFNPVHRGHWELARVAEQILEEPVAFELSAVNVDKPMLPREELRRRLAPFNWQASVWLTQAPRFLDKAELFPGVTFVVGADTAVRIVSPRYYDNDVGRMLTALARLRELECRFLVACRTDDRGQCLTLADVPTPAEFAALFTEISPIQFRWDISSTELRSR